MKLLQCQYKHTHKNAYRFNEVRSRLLQIRFQEPSKCFNHFRTGQGLRHANMHKRGLAQSPSCDYGQRQTMNHIVDMCPLTKFEGRLNLLHEASGDSHMPKIYSDCSTREIIIIITAV